MSRTFPLMMLSFHEGGKTNDYMWTLSVTMYAPLYRKGLKGFRLTWRCVQQTREKGTGKGTEWAKPRMLKRAWHAWKLDGVAAAED